MREKTPPAKGTTSVPCPTCNQPVPWTAASPWRPFCSERCRLIDLGDWLDENHKISQPMEGYSEEDPSP